MGMKKLMVSFTCIYSVVLIFTAFRSTAQTGPSAPRTARGRSGRRASQQKRENQTAGSFTLANKTGVYTTATPRTISIQGVTLNPIFSKQKGKDASNQIINDLKFQEVSSDDENPTSVVLGVAGFQLKIGNKIYLVSLHGIPPNAALEIVDRGAGYAIQSPKDAMVKIQPIIIKYSKGQTQILKTGIDIPDLPPEIFSIRRMKLPGLNPLSG